MRIKCLFALKIIVVLTAIHFNQFSYSQNYYQTGKIILTNGKTLEGKVKRIDYCTLVFNNENEGLNLKSEEVQSFVSGENEYISKHVMYMINQNSIEFPEYNENINLKSGQVFLRKIVEGSKSLFECDFGIFGKQFFIENGEKIEVLGYKEYQFENKNNFYKIFTSQYINQLDGYLDINCVEKNLALKNLKYKEKYLSKLFIVYFKCQNEENYYISKQLPITFEYGISSGITASQLSSVAVDDYIKYEHFGNADYKPKASFNASVFQEINLPYRNYRWSIRNELMYNSSKSYHEYETKFSKVNSTYHRVNLNFDYLKLYTLVDFNSVLSNFDISFGVSNGTVIKSINRDNITRKLYSTEVNEEIPAIEETSNYEQSIVLGFRYNFKKITISLIHERGSGLSDFALLALHNNYLMLNVSYIFY